MEKLEEQKMQYHSHGEKHADAHSPNSSHNHSMVKEEDNIAKQKRSMRILKFVIILTFGFALIEAVSGYLFNSLALMSDAAHMLTDSSSLLLALIMAYFGSKPADNNHSYGHGRFEVLGALANGVFMLFVIVYIFIESLRKFSNPGEVNAIPMLVVASMGLIINIVAFLILNKDNHNMNVKAATLHVMGDLLASVAAIVSAILIYYTGYHIIDPILSMLISIILIPATYSILKKSVHILLEGVPEDIDFYEVGDTLKTIENVRNIHDLHIWSLDSKNYAMSAHVTITDFNEWNSVLKSIQKTLYEKYNIVHVTLQPELVGSDTPFKNEILGEYCPIKLENDIQEDREISLSHGHGHNCSSHHH